MESSTNAAWFSEGVRIETRGRLDIGNIGNGARGRAGSYRLRVLASAPVRLYLAHTPWTRGRGFVMWKLLRPLLPPRPASFTAELPDGLRLELQYRELLGLEVLTGGFELEEARALA